MQQEGNSMSRPLPCVRQPPAKKPYKLSQSDPERRQGKETYLLAHGAAVLRPLVATAALTPEKPTELSPCNPGRRQGTETYLLAHGAAVAEAIGGDSGPKP